MVVGRLHEIAERSAYVKCSNVRYRSIARFVVFLFPVGAECLVVKTYQRGSRRLLPRNTGKKGEQVCRLCNLACNSALDRFFAFSMS